MSSTQFVEYPSFPPNSSSASPSITPSSPPSASSSSTSIGSALPSAEGNAAASTASPTPSSTPPSQSHSLPQSQPSYESKGSSPSTPTDPSDVSGLSTPTLPFKLFVGQIPPFTSEDTLRATFSPFGTISDVVILKDRHTGAHKGCGFVCFTTKQAADMAIMNLGDKVRLPNAKREMIVRYAGDRPDEREYKLYVCMLSRQSTEHDVRQIFEPFGPLTEVFIIRSREGNQSKGAAFVKFANREDAERAIIAIHDKIKDKDCPGLIQVRFAHTKEERAAHLSHVLGTHHAAHAVHMMNRMGASGPQSAGTMSSPYSQLAGYPAAAAAAAMGYGQIPNMGKFSPTSYNAYGAFGRSGGATDFSALFDSASAQSPYTAAYSHPHPSSPHHYASSASMGVGGAGGFGGAQSSVGMSSGSSVKDPRGPDGANLFVYNIPESYSEADLNTLFSNFGTVLSTRIQRDLSTGVSKGFGFVSYDDPNAAQSAITQLDGFTIGNKRLTVRLKSHGHGGHGHMGGSSGGSVVGGMGMGGGSPSSVGVAGIPHSHRQQYGGVVGVLPQSAPLSMHPHVNGNSPLAAFSPSAVASAAAAAAAVNAQTHSSQLSYTQQNSMQQFRGY